MVFNVTSMLLVFSFVLAPFSSVLAQEAPPPSVGTSQLATTLLEDTTSKDLNTTPNTLVLSPTGESEPGLPEESSKSATQDVQNSKSASDIPPEEGAESESSAEMQSMLSESGESTQTRDMSRFE